MSSNPRLYLSPIPFDEPAEEAAVLIRTKPQTSVRRPGVSREQAQRFFDRRSAVMEASRHQYADRTFAKDRIDALIADGYTRAVILGSTIKLEREDGMAVKLAHNRPVERTYVKVLFNIEDLARQ